MKKITSLTFILLLCTPISSTITSCSKESSDGQKEIVDPVIPTTPENPSGGGSEPSTPPTPTEQQFVLQGSMQATSDLVGKDFNEIHKYMRTKGWDYSEHPNSSEDDHFNGIHCEVVYDSSISQHVFKFTNHANAEVLDGDRGKLEDRQRNEMKSQTSSAWYKLNGNWDEWQKLEWKFRIPKGYQPSTSFCHIHQLKAQEGNNSSPVITITLRSNSNGSNRRVQVIHTGDNSSTTKGTIIDNLPLEDFEDQWIQVTTQMHYTHSGTFKIKMERISDGKVLVEKSFTDIDMWRRAAISIRNKFGIYRSFGRKMESKEDRPTNGIKDETLQLADFKAYERNTNPNPQSHD